MNVSNMRRILIFSLTLLSLALAQRIAVFGDWGAESPNRPLVAEALRKSQARQPFDALLTLGDNFYPSGEPILKFLEDLPKVRIYPAFGNHDVPALAKQLKLFGVERAYYSFKLQNLEIFVVYSEEFTAQQREWLQATLATSTAPWKIVAFHRAIYSSGLHGGNRPLRAAIEPLLLKYKVPIVLTGHDHDYERLEAKGIAYIVSGGGGAYLRDFLLVQPGSKVRKVSLNYLILEASPNRLLMTALNEKNELIDRIELKK